MDKVRVLETDREMKVFSDPFRLRIISAYRKSKEAMTAKAVADSLGVAPSKVYYHVKKLIEVNILALDHTKVINGILAKYYKLTAEEFKLEVSDKSGDVNSLVDQTVLVFNSVFEEVKSIIYDTASRVLKGEEDANGKGSFLTSTDIYMNDEEALAFNKDILALIDKHVEKKTDDQNCYKAVVTAVQQFED